jgi:hypothetical protein
MAIAIGSKVALKTLGQSPFGIGQVNAQPPLFGVSQTASPGPYVVDWDNGLQSTVAAAATDELLLAAAGTRALLGKVVNIVGQSSAYNALVVSVYNRNGTQECVLVKTLSNGTYYELDAAAVVPQPNL